MRGEVVTNGGAERLPECDHGAIVRARLPFRCPRTTDTTSLGSDRG
jgi:hypothetical protein